MEEKDQGNLLHQNQMLLNFWACTEILFSLKEIFAPAIFNAERIALSACAELRSSPSTLMFPAIAEATSKNEAPLQSPSTV